MKKRIVSRILLSLLALCLACAAVPGAALADLSLSLGSERLTKGNIIYLGKNQFNDDLRWRVLHTNGEKALLITLNAIRMEYMFGDKEFPFIDYDYIDDFSDGEPVYDSWEKSGIRKLCRDLYQSWKRGGAEKLEVQAILSTDIEETESYRGGRFDFEFLPRSIKGEHFFLLSAREADLYFDSEADRIANGPDREPVWWWLRSPIHHESIYLDRSYIIATVDDGGWLNSLDVLQNYNIPFAGFRPACYLDMTKVLFTTEASKDGKPKDANTASMEPVTEGNGKDRKLTLLDEKQKFTVDTDAVTASPGGCFSFNFEGAAKNAKTAISVLICSKEGTPLYYGSQAAFMTTEGTAEFPVPAELAPGEYILKVFSEIRNNKTTSDFASAFADVVLTVQ